VGYGSVKATVVAPHPVMPLFKTPLGNSKPGMSPKNLIPELTFSVNVYFIVFLFNCETFYL
jgi:hypothetical protein